VFTIQPLVCYIIANDLLLSFFSISPLRAVLERKSLFRQPLRGHLIPLAKSYSGLQQNPSVFAQDGVCLSD